MPYLKAQIKAYTNSRVGVFFTSRCMRGAVATPLPFGRIKLKSISMSTSALTGLNGQSTFIAPPVTVYTIANGFAGKTSASAPFVYAQRFTKRNNYSIVPFVSCLGCGGSPSYITFFIMTIYINAIKRMFRRRPSSKMFKKFLIRLKTKLNSTSAIIGVIAVFGVITSLTTMNICLIFRCIVHMYGFTVQKTRVGFEWFYSKLIYSHCSKDNSFMNMVRAVGSGNFFQPAFIVT